MILILTDTDEPTTDLVIDWLLFFRKSFVRISNEDKIELDRIFFDNSKLEAIFTIYKKSLKQKILDTRNIKSYWYRRSNLSIKVDDIKSSDENIKEILFNLKKEEKIASIKILNHILNSKKNINSFEDNYILKVIELETALSVGLKIPDTFICKNKSDFTFFNNKHKGKIITKSIDSNTSFYRYNYHSYTAKVNEKNVPPIFSLSLLQKEISKFVELRIFVLNKEFFSSAIFSQLDRNTQTDLKNHNVKKPNRIVPFKLPNEIKKKLTLLMQKLKINSGSIDMIITKNLEYVFLEINPIGQFEQVAMPCNYNLFKIIAEYL